MSLSELRLTLRSTYTNRTPTLCTRGGTNGSRTNLVAVTSIHSTISLAHHISLLSAERNTAGQRPPETCTPHVPNDVLERFPQSSALYEDECLQHPTRSLYTMGNDEQSCSSMPLVMGAKEGWSGTVVASGNIHHCHVRANLSKALHSAAPALRVRCSLLSSRGFLTRGQPSTMYGRARTPLCVCVCVGGGGRVSF